ncbi:MAG: transporter substrate-binding domain-containing protein [Candidatus Phocaeicola faecipullorum]|nr:transporter substrate-binding domain-containing protein [Candidatus Phocaeicola faecipullorum]
MNKRSILIAVLLLFLVVLATVTFLYTSKEDDVEIIHGDLDDIIEDGELIVLTINSYASYFSYRESPMGFQYELAQGFAKSLGVELKVKVVNSEVELVKALLNGEGDLIAYNLAITNERKKELIYCGKENVSHQVLVQRNGKDVLNDVTQLVGKEVYVMPGKYEMRLKNLNQELGGGIMIHEINQDSITNEDLITMVAEGKIDYTVTNNELAKINKTYNPNLNISMEISFDQRSAWAVRKTSPKLAEAADKWHRENINSAEYEASARRYFELNKHTPQAAILSLKDGRISHYDDLFKKYALQINWDWRLLAALVYTESNFNPGAVSWAGAKGLMQLMPVTARAYGVPAGMESDPEQSIKGGVKYIAALQKIFSKVRDEDRVKFVLASYNSGIGHVFDAMALAEKYGKDKYLWDGNVAVYMLLKNREEYYKDPVCKNGYFRGTETYNFVRDVMTRADVYMRNIKN